jgi:hypothetical protein
MPVLQCAEVFRINLPLPCEVVYEAPHYDRIPVKDCVRVNGTSLRCYRPNSLLQTFDLRYDVRNPRELPNRLIVAGIAD